MGASKRSTTEASGRISRAAIALTAVVVAAAAGGTVLSRSNPAAAVAVPPPARVSPPVSTTTEPSTIESAARPAMQMIDLSPEQVELVTHAVGLFAESGLVLPPLVVEGHDDTAACDGHDGLHRPHSGWSEIDLCVDDPESRAVMHTVLHEIAHAWAAGGLTDERRAAFQELRGFEVWRDYEEAAWEDNGTEQAAEIIAWGVNDQPAATIRIDQVSCSELRDGYVALTGVEPVHGLTTICDIPPAQRT
jgi:hypothetical protein